MTKQFICGCLITVLAVVVSTGHTAAAASKKPVDISKLPPASTKAGVTYSSDIKPILDRSCIRCHGPEKPKAQLRLDSLEGVLKGAAGGKVLRAGNSAGSQLVHSIAFLGDEDHHMPPPGNKAGIAPLSPEQIGLVRAWIDQGAK